MVPSIPIKRCCFPKRTERGGFERFTIWWCFWSFSTYCSIVTYAFASLVCGIVIARSIHFHELVLLRLFVSKTILRFVHHCTMKFISNIRNCQKNKKNCVNGNCWSLLFIHWVIVVSFILCSCMSNCILHKIPTFKFCCYYNTIQWIYSTLKNYIKRLITSLNLICMHKL